MFSLSLKSSISQQSFHGVVNGQSDRPTDRYSLPQLEIINITAVVPSCSKWVRATDRPIGIFSLSLKSSISQQPFNVQYFVQPKDARRRPVKGKRTSVAGAGPSVPTLLNKSNPRSLASCQGNLVEFCLLSKGENTVSSHSYSYIVAQNSKIYL